MTVQKMLQDLRDADMTIEEIAFRMSVTGRTISRWLVEEPIRMNKFQKAHLLKIYKRRLGK